jgi:hypothetical protein
VGRKTHPVFKFQGELKMADYTHNREANDGAYTSTNTVSGVTGYRSDLASGITAAEVPYSAALVDVEVTAVPLVQTYTNVTNVLTAAE